MVAINVGDLFLFFLSKPPFASHFSVLSQESACNHRRCIRAPPPLPARASEEHAGRAGDGHGSQAGRHRTQDPALQPAAARREGGHPDPAGAP